MGKQSIVGIRGALGFAMGFVIAVTFMSVPKSTYTSNSSNTRSERRIKKCILFGDSITQESYNPELGGWVASLSSYWIRRMDVINRGFSGYTTKWGLALFDTVVIDQKPDVIFLFFGANDAVVAEHAQHVPLGEYQSNLDIMTKKAKEIGATVFLLTPPTVYEPVLEQRNKEKGKKLIVDRINTNTLRYVEACKEVGQKYEVTVIDNWSTMGGNTDERKEYTRDGLHLSVAGNKQVYENILRVINDKFQHLKSDNMKMFQPHWSEIIADPSVL